MIEVIKKLLDLMQDHPDMLDTKEAGEAFALIAESEGRRSKEKADHSADLSVR